MADTIDEQLDRIKDIAEDSKEHAQAIMSFVFFTFCLQIITLVSAQPAYRARARPGFPARAGLGRTAAGARTLGLCLFRTAGHAGGLAAALYAVGLPPSRRSLRSLSAGIACVARWADLGLHDLQDHAA